MLERWLPTIIANALRYFSIAVILIYALSLFYLLIFGPYDFTLAGVRIHLFSPEKPVQALVFANLVLLFVSKEFYGKVTGFFKHTGPWSATMLILLFYIAVMVLALQKHDFNIGHFVHAGDRFYKNSGAADIPVLKNSHGYDGQFFYRLALDPLVQNEEIEPKLDSPAYRQQRILYPAIAYAISFHNRRLAPYSLVGVNLFCLYLLALAGVYYARGIGLNPVWGLVFSGYAGFVVSFLYDLAEPMSILFLLAGLLAVRAKKYRAAAFVWTLAALTRETTLLAPIAVILLSGYGLLRGSGAAKERIPLYAGVIPVTVFVMWSIFLYFKWGVFPFQQSYGNFDYPLVAVIREVNGYLSGANTHYRLYDLFLLAGFATIGVAAAFGLRSKKVAPSERLTFILYLVFALCFGKAIWESSAGYLRALSEFFALSAMIVLADRTRAAPYIFLYWVVVLIWVAKRTI